MRFMQDRPRLPLRDPKPFDKDEYLLGSFTPDLIRDRVQREPYAATWRGLRQRARKAAGANVTAHDMPEMERSEYVLALALSWYLTGSATHRHRAEDALYASGRGPWVSWCSGPEAITRYALAIDLLRTGGDIRNEYAFVELVGQFVAGGVAVNDQLPKNNWQFGALSAIGLTALLFWHRNTPWPVRDWLEVALDGLSRLLYGQVSEDGVYLEGPGYSRRTSVAFLPFAWALKERTGLDLINFPSVAAWMRWVALVATPDGANPMIDDSRPENIQPWALLVNRGCKEAPLFRWAFDRQGVFDRSWEETALFLYDDGIKPKPPKPPENPPCEVLEKGGVARFRTDWSEEATYGLLVSRPLPPFGPGHTDSAHRHEDPTNFLLYGNRELLTLEAGYGGYSHPERYNWMLTGEAHNLILVDGQGPPRLTHFRPNRWGPNVSTSHGRVREVCRDRDLVAAAAETSYLQVDFARWMAFVRGEYFVIMDTVESAAPHTYSWVLHGAGKLRTLRQGRAVWETTRSRLDVRWVHPTDLHLTRCAGVHFREHGHIGSPHQYVIWVST